MATIELNRDTFNPTVRQGGIVLIDWWAPWCGPCRAFGPIYERVSAKYPELTFAKVNTEAERELAAAYEIRSIPTLMIVRDGVLLFSQPGMLPQGLLEELIERVSQLDMTELKRQVAPTESVAPEA